MAVDVHGPASSKRPAIAHTIESAGGVAAGCVLLGMIAAAAATNLPPTKSEIGADAPDTDSRGDTSQIGEADTGGAPANPQDAGPATSDDDGCEPPCGEGYRCLAGLCLSGCSPPCAVDGFCTAHGECVEKYPRKRRESAPRENDDFDMAEYRPRKGYLAEDPSSASPRARRRTVAWFGAHIGGGVAAAFGDVWRDDVTDRYGADRTANISFGGWFDFHYYFHPRFALVTGLGFLNRGDKKQSTTEDISVQDTVINLEIPLGAKWWFMNIQLGAALALDIGVVGRTRTMLGVEPDTVTWGPKQWADHRRVNLGAVLFAGYAFESSTVLVIPGVDISLHLLSDLTATDAAGTVKKNRYINAFVTIGLVRAR